METYERNTDIAPRKGKGKWKNYALGALAVLFLYTAGSYLIAENKRKNDAVFNKIKNPSRIEQVSVPSYEQDKNLGLNRFAYQCMGKKIGIQYLPAVIQEIKDLNKGKNLDVLIAGQELKVPVYE